MEVEQRWHPVTGSITYRRVGAASVGYGYDEMGRLTDIRSNGKQVFTLGYDPTTVRGRISRIVSRDDVFTFAYSNGDKVSRIDVDGVGALVITYDATGEIDEVKSEGGGVALSLKVSAAMKLLQSSTAARPAARTRLICPWTTGNWIA